MNKIAIFHAVPNEDGYTRIGSFSVNAKGSAELEVLDARFESELQELSAGVAPYSLKRTVRPEEGELFLNAVSEHFRQSSYWRVVDESP